MRYSAVLDTLQNLTKRKPTQQEIANILGVKQGVIGNRAVRNSMFTAEDLNKLEKHYNISFYNKTSVDAVELPYYPNVKASCGYGVVVFDETSEKIQVPKIQIKDYSPNKTYSVINAIGNSMTPTICENDKVIIANNAEIQDNHIYVLRYKDDIYLKRLQKNINQLIIKSDNADYDTIKLVDNETKDVQVLGECIGLIREL